MKKYIAVLQSSDDIEQHIIKKHVTSHKDGRLLAVYDVSNITTAIQDCRVGHCFLIASTIKDYADDLKVLYSMAKYVNRRLSVCNQSVNDTLALGIIERLIMKENEETRQAIKKGIAEAKAKGKRLGNPYTTNGTEEARTRMKELAMLRKQKALGSKANVLAWEAIKDMSDATLQERCNKLNEQGLLTPKGRYWKPTQVARLVWHHTPKIQMQK